MKSVESGTFPQVRRAFQVTRCNQCADAPWGWRVSLYTWTKGLAVGGLLVPLILVLAGLLAHEHAYVQAGQSVPLA